MGRIQRTGLITATAAAISAAVITPAPSAHAAPCPDAEVMFARGTTELPGLGPTGEAFVNSLRTQVGAKSVGVYAINYPATLNFATAVDGIRDARAHLLETVANCPETKMVLGGFSQGAAVMGFVTTNAVPDGVSPAEVPEPMPPDVADHVVAVALFGKPSTRFMRAINDPTIVIGPQYVGKTIDLCVNDDLVCDQRGKSFSVHNQYVEQGMVDQGAKFVAAQLQASWAVDQALPPTTAAPAPSAPTATPAPLSVPAPRSVPAPLSVPAAGPAPTPHLPPVQTPTGPPPGPVAPLPPPPSAA